MVCSGCSNTIRNVFQNLYGIHNQQALLEFLANHNVINEVYLCHLCEYIVPARYSKGSQIVFRCKRGHAKYSYSAIRGSFLESNMPPQKIIHFCILWCTLPNSRGPVIEDELPCSPNTLVNWSNYCREICINWALENRKPIGGVGTVVEIEVSKFGRRKYNSGHRIEGQWVFGGVQRNIHSNFFLLPVEAKTRETLLDAIQQWILPGTTIISDCWKSYDTLQDEAFQHLRVNHSVEFINTDVNDEIHMENPHLSAGQNHLTHTNSTKSKWRYSKYSIPVFGRKKEHLAGCLAEYVFKKTYRSTERLHHLLIEAAKDFPPEF